MQLHTPSLTASDAANLHRKVADAFPANLAKLGQLVRIQGIAWEAFDPANLEQSAREVAKLFEATGVFESVSVRRSKYADKVGAPAVIAHRPARNGRPQILLYAHHDVQPPGDESAWMTPPFEPTLRDGRLFGRGAADDKAGVVAHLAAIQAFAETAGADFELGLSVFIEGEEEAGSPSFRQFLEENRSDLRSDVIIVADSSNWTTEVPALTTTLRGLVSQVIEIRTLEHALHSGMYGGVVPDANLALIRLLASLHDEKGNVAVPGLHSTSAANLNYSEDDLRRDAGVLQQVDLIGEGTILDRIWTKPSITVIGIDSPSVAISSNTLMPSARAKISLRLAPGDNPDSALEALRAHLLANLPFGAQLTFGDIELGKPFQTDANGWAKSTMDLALSLAWGAKSVDIGIGGSIPFIADLLELFPDAQILVTGVEDPDSRAHSPNESLHLETWKKAIVAEALFLFAGNQASLS